MQKLLGFIFLYLAITSLPANADMLVCEIETAHTSDGVSNKNLSDISKMQIESFGVSKITQNVIVHIDKENIEAVLQSGDPFVGSPFKIKFFGKNIITAVGETKTCQESMQMDKMTNTLLFGMLCLQGSRSS